jgi:DNA polymerase-3 subunit beta
MNVDRKALKAALAASKRVTSARPGIPALLGVKIEAGAHGLTLTTTDLEASWSAMIPGGTEYHWAALVPRAMLAEAVKNGPDRIIMRPDDHGGIIIGSGTLRGLPLADFPNLPEPGGVVAVVDAAELRNGLRIVTPAASGDAARPVLTGVFAEITPDTVTLTATDSYRLHHVEVTAEPVDYLNPHGAAAIIPARVLVALERIIGAKGSGPVTITADDSHVGFILPDGTRIGSRIIEGTYPNYQQLIPDADLAGTITATYGPDLSDVLERAGTFARDTTPVRFTFRAGIGIDVSASSPDLGSFAEPYPAPEVSEDVACAFNPFYLGQALAAFGAGTFAVRDGLKPGMVRPFAGSGFALVMPVRLPAPVEVAA